MSNVGPYLLDSDVFIQAKNQYYAFSICPGFWDCLLGHFQLGNIFSLQEIREELLRGNDEEDLVRWVKNKLPRDFFLPASEQNVTRHFQDIILWVQENSQFKDQAKSKFAAGADGWLAAFAKAHNYVVVTGEQFHPDAKNRVPLPNVCKKFDVQYGDVFKMLCDLGVQFEWKR
ncbi:MAG TPA: DUF4411 family protein [Candidatus Hydrogenedentes bacterium]|jgi:predicted nucleic acid-binding protein|nr:DUF4411 family protein [Candidatus Hydrogenedentota bacterium]HPJ99080.1 DUF4411 family protein [Candidatus Hydrogenedentota bacterium]